MLRSMRLIPHATCSARLGTHAVESAAILMSRRGRLDYSPADEGQPQQSSHAHLHSNRAGGYAAAAAAAASASSLASGLVGRSAPSPQDRTHIVPSRRRNSQTRPQAAFIPASAYSRGAGSAAAASHSHAASSVAADPAPSPAADRRPAKRVKKEPAAASSNSAAAAAASASKSAPLHSQHKEDLVCSVCLELPPGEIFQCGEGHLLCKPCHRRILLGPRPICPICRMRLSRNNPSRNRFAERVKDEMQVACTNVPCPELVKHAELPKHLSSCGFRASKCSVHSLGPRELLDAVKRRNVKYQQAKEDIRSTAALQAHLCRMLSKRCRDMVIRDLLIELDPHTGELASHPFRAVGMSWEVVMDRAPAGAEAQDVKIHLRIVDRPQRKLILECFVLSGPDLPIELSPTLRRVVFRKSVGLSESFPLPVTVDQAREIHNRQTLSLRMGFLDCTIGPLTQEFTSVRQVQYAMREEPSDGESSDGDSDRDRADSPVVYPDDVDDDAFDDDPLMDDYLEPAETDAMERAEEADDMEPASTEGSEGEPQHAQQPHPHDDAEDPAQFDDDGLLPPTVEEEEAAQELDVYEGEGEGEGTGESLDGEIEEIEDDDEDDEPQHAAASSSAAAHNAGTVYSQPTAYISRPVASPSAPRVYSQR